MTELQAWQRIRDSWANPDNLRTTACCEVFNDDFQAYGLCSSISTLRDIDQLSNKTIESMQDKISLAWLENTVYVWPLTLEGAEQRVAFCQKQIDLLS